MAITQEFMFETDDLDEFLKVAKSMLPILFTAGSNENQQFHKMYYNKSEEPRYWFLMPESNGNEAPKRKCVLCLTHHLSKPKFSDEIEVPMEFKLNILNNSRNKLIWKKSSYRKLMEIVKEAVSIDESEFENNFPVNGWIADEPDGSHGVNYKMEWKESTPGSLYFSIGYTYYSK